MNNLIQEGKTIRWTNDTGSTVLSGGVVNLNGQLYIAHGDIANGAEGVLYGAGSVFALKKTTGALVQGAHVCYDMTNDYVVAETTTVEHPYAGVVWSAAASGDSTVNVKLLDRGAKGKGVIDLLWGLTTLDDGTVLAKFADGADPAPGIKQETSGRCIRWNNHATPTPISMSAALPADLDADKDVTVHFQAKMSAGNDSPELTHNVYFNDSTSDKAGTDPEVTGGTTLTEYTATIAAADVPDPPGVVHLLVQPKDGELGTDDAQLYGAWLEYSRK